MSVIAGYRRKGDDLYYRNAKGKRTEKGSIKYRQLPRKLRITAFRAKQTKTTKTVTINDTTYRISKNGDFGVVKNVNEELIVKWLRGDLDANQSLLLSIAKCARDANRVLNVNSGKRSYGEQVTLWNRFLAGIGAPANRPGTSNHEGGAAADVVDYKNRSLSFFNIKGMEKLATKYRLYQPYAHEAWHVERRK